MEMDKIELLVKKIDHAITIIQKLKDINSTQEKQIEKQKNEINKMKEENEKLKEENKKQKDEINKTNDLHKRLEEKIQQILQYLPDEDIEEVKKDTKPKKENKKESVSHNKKEEKVKKEEKDSERLELLVDEPEKFEKKSLFAHEESSNNVTNDQVEAEETISDFELPEEEIVDVDIKENDNEEEFDVNFDDTLLDENGSDIEFDFDDESDNGNKDLPKGVL